MIQERILLLMKSLELNPTQFADEIGVQRSSISHILSGRNNPSLDIVTKILNRFPNIDSNWLVLGKGSLVAKNEENNFLEENNQFSEPSKPPLNTFSNSLFDDYQENNPQNKTEDEIEELQKKIEQLEKSITQNQKEEKTIQQEKKSNTESIKEDFYPIDRIKEPINRSDGYVDDNLGKVLEQKPESIENLKEKTEKNGALKPLIQKNLKEIIRLIVIYSDNTFEDLTKN